MGKIQVFVVGAFLAMFFSSQSFAQSGRIGSGGGNVCFIQGRPILLDFVRPKMTLDLSKPGVKFEFQSRYRRLGLQPFRAISNPHLQQEVSGILDQLKDYQSIQHLLKLSLEKFQALGVEGKFAALGADYGSSEGLCSMENTKAAVIFHSTYLFVSVELWNQLDLLSQVGLVIHEALRMLQNIYQFKMTDRELQDLTYALVSKDLVNFSKILGDCISREDQGLARLRSALIDMAQDLFAQGKIDQKLNESLKAFSNTPFPKSGIGSEMLLNSPHLQPGAQEPKISSTEFRHLSRLVHALSASYSLFSVNKNTTNFALAFVVPDQLFEAIDNWASHPYTRTWDHGEQYIREHQIPRIQNLLREFGTY